MGHAENRPSRTPDELSDLPRAIALHRAQEEHLALLGSKLAKGPAKHLLVDLEGLIALRIRENTQATEFLLATERLDDHSHLATILIDETTANGSE
jgi:hypothetical protein